MPTSSQPSSAFNKPQLNALTGLRFLLALWVIVFHQTSDDGYLVPLMLRIPNILFCVMRTGYVAVGIFFALSGFVLSYAHSAQLSRQWRWNEWLRFLYNRFARIYPGYAAGLLLVMPIAAYELAKMRLPILTGKELSITLMNWTLLQAWAPSMAASWNGPAWSLSDEAFFYAVFPIAGVLVWKLSGTGTLAATAIFLWLAGLAAPLAAVLLPVQGFGDAMATSTLSQADPIVTNFFKYFPLLHLPDFCIGIVAGRMFQTMRSSGSGMAERGYLIYGPAAALEVAILCLSDRIPYPLLHGGLLLPLHGLLILGLALSGGSLARLLSKPSMVFLGHASYAMYIIHLPLGIWLNFGLRLLRPGRPTGLGIMVIYVIVVIVLASFIYKAIEQPANRMLRRRFSRFEQQRTPAPTASTPF